MSLSPVIEIKNGTVHLPILKLFSSDADRVSAQLKDRVEHAPDFFRHAPMAVDLHALADDAFDFQTLLRTMRSLGVVPVGVCGSAERLIHAARDAGLPLLTLPRHENQAPPETAKPAEAKPQPVSTSNRLIDQPVRSGQRVYVQGGDLVVTAQVSAGAEIMADGNIHVYGTLRGRALAGVQGNLGCRIFCHDLQAELVSVGHYKISENIDDSVRGQPVQVYLQDNTLKIDKI